MSPEEIVRRLKILWEKYLSQPDVNDQKKVQNE